MNILLNDIPAYIDKLNADLAAVTAQRDALLEAMRSIEWSDSYQMCVDLARAAISAAERKEP